MRSASSSRVTVLTTAQAAAALGVHERTVRRYVSMGLLGHRRLPGGHYRIPEEALAEFWQANERPAARAPDADPGRSTRERDRQRRGRTGASRRRSLGQDDATSPYDLSIEALSTLRSQRS